jgi:hypothetical protein
LTRRQLVIWWGLVIAFAGPTLAFGLLGWDLAKTLYFIGALGAIVVFNREISDWIWPPKPKELDAATLEFVRQMVLSGRITGRWGGWGDNQVLNELRAVDAQIVEIIAMIGEGHTTSDAVLGEYARRFIEAETL